MKNKKNHFFSFESEINIFFKLNKMNLFEKSVILSENKKVFSIKKRIIFLIMKNPKYIYIENFS